MVPLAFEGLEASLIQFRFCPAFTCAPILSPEAFGSQNPDLVPALSPRPSHCLTWSIGPQETLAREIQTPAWPPADNLSFNGAGEGKA